MSDSIPVVHVTDVLSYFTCRLRWAWQSRLRMNLEPVQPQRPFVTGTAFHEGTRNLYEHDLSSALAAVSKHFQSALQQYRQSGGMVDDQLLQRLQEDQELCVGMLMSYVQWAEEVDKDWEVIDTEREFGFGFGWDGKVLGVAPQVVLAGRIDGISIHIPSQTVWLREYKTARSIPEEEKRISKDLQARFYCAMAELLTGREVAGIEYRFVRKAVPTMPAFLKRGGLSVALTGAGADVTPATFRQAFQLYYSEEPTLDSLNKHGYGDHYLALLSRERDEPQFVKQYMLQKTRESQHSAVLTVLAAAQEMLSPETAIYAQPDWWKCEWCAFRSPCDYVEDGKDPLLMLKHMYRVRADYERVDADSEVPAQGAVSIEVTE